MKKTYKNKIINLTISLSMLLFSLGRTRDLEKQKCVGYHDIIILPHGTILPIPSFLAIGKTLKGNKSDPKNKKFSFDEKYLNNLRLEGFHRYQPINKLGLVKIDEKEDPQDNVYLKTTKKIISSYRNIDKLTNKKTYNKDSQSFYTFGWTGKLEQKNRLLWAKKLYKKIIKEKAVLEKELGNKKIRVKLIAHSHGGNVCLNLAKAEEEFKQNLEIEELVLLGTPVQSETKVLINSPIFKNLYNIYSTGDVVQIADIISTKDSISHRTFKPDPKTGFTVPDKVKQIEIRVGVKKPLHTELWFAGEPGNFLYRRTFPIHPDPVLVYVPLIIKFTEKYNDKNNFILNLNAKRVNEVI